MTKREAAIVSAYTGSLLGEFSDFHAYVEELLGEPVFTHQFARKDFEGQIRVLSQVDFINMEVV